MAGFVLDASMAAAWHFKDEETPQTAAVEGMTDHEPVVVPANWFAEMANTLVMGERGPRASQADTARFIGRLGELEIMVDDLGGRDLFTVVLPLARAHRLTVYDALYLELAERRGLPLASLDGALVAAARSVGVRIMTDDL